MMRHLGVALVVVCSAMALGESAGARELQSQWPMFRGGPRQTGVATCDLPEKPVVLWQFKTGDVILSTAAIVEQVVYFGCDNGTLYALNLADGSVKWQTYTSPSTQPASAPASQPIRAAIQSSPTVHGDLVLFGDQDGVFHAVASKDGKPRWTFQAAAEVISSANCWKDRVVFGSYDNSVYCLALADGKLLWKYETEGRVHGTPAIVDDRALVSGCDGKLRSISLADGKQVGEVELGGYSGASAAVMGDSAFVGTFTNQVVGVNWAAGKILWNYENPDRQFPFYSSAAVTEKAVYIGGRDKTLHALDPKTGKPAWTFRAKGRIDSSPVVVGRRVFFGSTDGVLYALNDSTGVEVWQYDAGSPINASPAVSQGRLVIGTEDGVVLCFGERN